MTKYRRSLLKLDILLQLRLKEKPIKSVTELADIIGVLRPSASRSLHSLKKRGLVIQDSEGWHLTPVGETEATAARRAFLKRVERLRKAAERLCQGI